jgi:hypothetical protein
MNPSHTTGALHRIGQAATRKQLLRPVSAPNIHGSGGDGGFTVRKQFPRSTPPTHKPPRATSAATLRASRHDFQATETFALSDYPTKFGESSPGGEVPQPLTPAQAARQRATRAWLAKDFGAAVTEFGALAAEEEPGSEAQAEALRLRCTGLLRLGRLQEALREVQSAVAVYEKLGKGNVPHSSYLAVPLAMSERYAELQQLHGLVLLGLHRPEEAWPVLSKAILHRPKRLAAATAYFVEAALASKEASLPLEAYQLPSSLEESPGAHAKSSLARARRSGLTAKRASVAPVRPIDLPSTEVAATPVPVFRLVLRPRRTPWPIDFTLPPVAPTNAGASAPMRLKLFCAHKGAESEPHVCLTSSDQHSLVLVHARQDGLLELLSNSSAASWSLVERWLLGQPPKMLSREDFEVVWTGWLAEGRAPTTYEALARHEWSLRQQARTQAQRSRDEETLVQSRKHDELKEWLQELGLAEVEPLLRAEGVDLDSLQFMQEDDLVRIGIKQLGPRRTLMAARRTQTQYKAMGERLELLEKEKELLMHAHGQSQAESARAVHDAAIAAELIGGLKEELELERAQSAELRSGLQKTRARADREASRKEAWRGHATSFAGDSEALQARIA